MKRAVLATKREFRTIGCGNQRKTLDGGPERTGQGAGTLDNTTPAQPNVGLAAKWCSRALDAPMNVYYAASYHDR